MGNSLGHVDAARLDDLPVLGLTGWPFGYASNVLGLDGREGDGHVPSDHDRQIDRGFDASKDLERGLWPAGRAAYV
jgi:hypothetical protein